MANSQEILITVINPVAQTYIVNFNMQPRSGIADFNVRFTGYLSRNLTPEDDGIVNGERIEIWYFIASTNIWENTGVYAFTIVQPGQSYLAGYFEGEIGILASWLPPGTYRFRAQYAGNTTKGLLGCEAVRKQ